MCEVFHLHRKEKSLSQNSEEEKFAVYTKKVKSNEFILLLHISALVQYSDVHSIQAKINAKNMKHKHFFLSFSDK